MSIEKARRSAAAIVIGCAGSLLVLAYVALGALQVLVLNPLAAVPDRTLPEIYRDAAAANEPFAVGWVVAFAVIGAALSLGNLLLALRRQATWRGSAVCGLLILMLGAPAYFWASFSIGMSIADGFGTSGGDHSGWSGALFVVSGCAFLTLLLLAVEAGLRKAARSVGTRRTVADSVHSEA